MFDKERLTLKKELTFEKYDKLIDRLNKIPFKCGAYWPEKEQIDEILKEGLEKNLEFLLWIMETADEPKTEEEEESKKYINSILCQNVKLYD